MLNQGGPEKKEQSQQAWELHLTSFIHKHKNVQEELKSHF